MKKNDISIIDIALRAMYHADNYKMNLLTGGA